MLDLEGGWWPRGSQGGRGEIEVETESEEEGGGGGGGGCPCVWEERMGGGEVVKLEGRNSSGRWPEFMQMPHIHCTPPHGKDLRHTCHWLRTRANTHPLPHSN